MPVYGSYSANKIQFGRESTAGTAVPATEIWRGAFASLTDERTKETVEEQVGALVMPERTYTSKYMGKLQMPATPLTFEQVCHILEAGVKAASAGSAPGYKRTYTFPVSNTPNTIKSYTIEAYNTFVSSDGRKMPYCFVEEFELSGNAGEAWQMSATWTGRQLVTMTPTSLTTVIPVKEAMFPKTLLYIDDEGSNGNTQMLGVLMGLTMRVKTGIITVPVGDGSLYFASHKFTKPEVTYTLTLELEDTSVVAAERLKYESDVMRSFKTTCAGADANHQFDMIWCGYYDSVSDYQNADGNTTVQLEGHCAFSTTESVYWTCEVTNGRASL